MSNSAFEIKKINKTNWTKNVIAYHITWHHIIPIRMNASMICVHFRHKILLKYQRLYENIECSNWTTIGEKKWKNWDQSKFIWYIKSPQVLIRWFIELTVHAHECKLKVVLRCTTCGAAVPRDVSISFLMRKTPIVFYILPLRT